MPTPVPTSSPAPSTAVDDAPSTAPAHVRGSLIDRWDEHLRRRWGPSALAAAQAAIRDAGLRAPSPVDPTAWYPAHLQIVIAQHLVTTHLDGRWDRLPEIVAGDVRHVLGRARSAVVRALGPGAVVANAEKLFSESYDVGRLEVRKRGRRHFEFAYHDAELFADPTWRRVQVAAWAAVFELTGKHAEVLADGGDAFVLTCRW